MTENDSRAAKTPSPSQTNLPCTYPTPGRAHTTLNQHAILTKSDQLTLYLLPHARIRQADPLPSLTLANPQRIPVSRDLYWGNRGEGRLTLSRS